MKKTREYPIYTIDAEKMLRLYERKDGRFDMTSEYDRRLIVEDLKVYAKSALFSQIIKAVKDAGGTDKPEIVTSKLVYIHFTEGIDDEKRDSVETLLEKGIKLKFKGNKGFVRFVPFDKSASMARQNVISFISEDVFAAVDCSLRLGLDWKMLTNVEPSKYYAYRGLYMTEGIEIPHDAFPLNEKTVIVVGNDNFPVFEKALCISNRNDTSDSSLIDLNNKVGLETFSEIEEIDSTPFDGEGLISPDYAQILNKRAVGIKDVEATSFQIRMPFTKGMLHRVDFHKFFRDQFPDENIEDLEITDWYGIKRNLSEVRIILTDSMFKCCHWLKQYFKMPGSNEDSNDYQFDPMWYYFNSFHKYKHSMYLVSSDVNFRAGDMIKMNYQFLNTLDLSREDFINLVNEHLENTRLLKEDPFVARNALLRMDNSEDDTINEEGASENLDKAAWEYALEKNIAFINDPKIKGLLKQLQDSQIVDVRRGRILVDGLLKYLSGDLLQLLINIAEACEVKDTDRIEYLRHYRTLYQDRFFIADMKKNGLNERDYYGILRSPHLSRNEQCALRPVNPSIYKKYFGHLKGVIIVSNKSSVPAALGGADFDGDTVKIIRDRIINEAIFNSVYERSLTSEETEDGVIIKREIKRKLPVAIIDSKRGPGKTLGSRITYDDLKAVFSSDVGTISNMAITIGKLEYSGDLPEANAARCTIATGLEIDSVKTGKKPDTSYLEKLIEDVDDKYLAIKRKIDRAYSKDEDKARIIQGRFNKEKNKYEAFFQYKNREKKEKIIFSIGEDQEYNIDLLPYLYIKEIAEKKRAKKEAYIEKYEIPQYCFDFEKKQGWRDNALKDFRRQPLEDIIGAYKKMNAYAGGVAAARKKAKGQSFRGKVFSQLYIEYDKAMDVFYESKANIEDAIETAYEVVYEAMPFKVNAEAALERMKYSNWKYIWDIKHKNAVLERILAEKGIPQKARDVLCDTYDSGYQLLNYILNDVKQYRMIEESDAEETRSGFITGSYSDSGKWNKSFDRDLYRLMRMRYLQYPENRLAWTKLAVEDCRNAIRKLFDGDMETAIRCTVALDRECDPTHTFLWDIFTVEEISRTIYREAEGAGHAE